MQEQIGQEAGFQSQVGELLGKHKAGYTWLFWIAGLSLINTAVLFSGAEISFIFGLGITQVIDAFAMTFINEGGGDAKGLIMGVAILFDVIAAGTFVLWGLMAKKGFGWAYIVGLIAYGSDTLWFLLAMDILSVGFHIFALVMIIRGFKACNALSRIRSEISENKPLTDLENPPPESMLP